uniref:Leucine-rich repeat-containing protein 15-like n=1 Tax=Diabrotica virgifera virgifera TaxID=50390 RepID=A0A6P7FN44_DIAVI
MQFTNGIIIFFVIVTVDEVLSKLFNYTTTKSESSCRETNCNTMLRCDDCSILRAGQSSNYFFIEKPFISIFVCSDYFNRVIITHELFDKLHKIEVIKITKTNAWRLQENTFPSSTTLRELYLSENNISIIDDFAFGHMTALTHLYLNNNKLKSFNAYTITSGFNIKYLNLGNNSFEGLMDTALYNLKSLTYLNLDGNKFKNISMGKLINNLESVKVVSMANNLLTRITKEFFDPLINLEVLNLAFNKISDIGNAFRHMENLKTLILSRNHLTAFSKFDFPRMGHSSLQYLAIDYNQLLLMPNVLEGIPFLKKIAVDGNPWYCNCLKQYRKVFHDRNIQEVCGGDVKYRCQDGNNCYRYDPVLSSIGAILDVENVNPDTPNSTYYCVLNEF